MSQPASLTEPRPGETVLSCPHLTSYWGQRAIFVGYKDPLKSGVLDFQDPGIGMLVRGADGAPFYIRWVVLCWWCRLRSWLQQKPPLPYTHLRMRWVGEESQPIKVWWDRF